MSQIQNALLMSKIVAIASNKLMFVDFIREFNNFFISADENMQNILKELETFRLLLSNKQFIFSANAIVQFEKELTYLIQENNSVAFFNKLRDNDILKIFHNELDEVLELLGNNFLDISENITVDKDIILDIESKLIALYSSVDSSLKADVKVILNEINKLKLESFYDSMFGYVKEIEKLSQKYNKKINPINFTCDKNILVPSTFKKLTKSLFHVFINCLEHGIEKPAMRVENGKDENGNISCNVVLISNILMVEISDDGFGIDLEALSNLAIEKNIMTKKDIDSMFEDEILALIFKDSISLKQEANASSGIGMSTIKKFVDELGGSLSVDSIVGQGSKFTFTVPVHYGLSDFINEDEDVFNSIVLQTQIFLEDSANIEFYITKDVDRFEVRDDNCYLEMRGDFEGKIVFSFSKELITQICSVLLDGMDKELILQMEKEIIYEIVNTVAGLAIQHFPTSRENTAISIPYSFDESFIKHDISCARKSIIKNIYTSHGKISCMLLEN